MRISALTALVMLAACASTEMRPYLGRPIQDVLLDYGTPVQVITLDDGRKAYQYRWGGGSYVLPGSSHATATTIGGVTTITGVATPSTIVSSDGCLIAFITTERDSREIVDEIRPPRQAVC